MLCMLQTANRPASWSYVSRLLCHPHQCTWSAHSTLQLYYSLSTGEIISQFLNKLPGWPCLTSPSSTTAKKADGEGKAAEERRKIVNGDGVTISVCFGDLTTENVDAIVNAANSALDHASGLAGAIIKKGGQSIQDESKEYIATHGRLEDGDVAVTKAGSLPCKNIIHAVGPIYYDGQRGEQIMLEVCMNNVLQTAANLKLRAISIPAISSGVFNYPKPACAKVLFDCVNQFLQANKNTSLKEIRFTNFDKETVDCFTAEFDKRWPQAAPQKPPVAMAGKPAPAPPPPMQAQPLINPAGLNELRGATVRKQLIEEDKMLEEKNDVDDILDE